MEIIQLAQSVIISLLKFLGFMWLIVQGAEILNATRFLKPIYIIVGVVFVLVAYSYVGKFMAVMDAVNQGVWR